ncbi:bifunctional adenosylcobinamide kinase/adenosylcobinamide-phosphate guanylyltransferase [Marinomonas sp.]
MRYLVLGGVRSGKSAYAEQLVAGNEQEVCYIATSQVWDDEMAARVRIHQERRPSHWQLIEEPIAVATRLNALSTGKQSVLVECLTLWLTNLICLEDEVRFAAEKAALLEAVANFQGELVLVSSEVGLGIIPMNAMARRFADEAGLLNQQLAKLTERVTLVAAGLPMPLKF